MKTEIIAALVPIVYVITEVYKLTVNKIPVGQKAKEWLKAFIPMIAIILGLVGSVLLYQVTVDSILSGLLAGLSAIGLYDGTKYTFKKIKDNTTPVPTVTTTTTDIPVTIPPVI